MTQQPLAKIAALPRPDLRTIFESDPGRLDRMTLVQGPLRFDWAIPLDGPDREPRFQFGLGGTL